MGRRPPFDAARQHLRARAEARPRTVAAVPEASSASPASSPAIPRWTFLTNHSHVLILLAKHPTMVLREVAAQVGITERAVQRIIADLEDSGYLRRIKVGRRNQYQLSTRLPLRHPVEGHCTIGHLIEMVVADE